MFSECGSPRSARTRPTKVSSRPAHSSGVGAEVTTRFGKASSAARAAPRSTSRANVARTSIAWPTITGTRTQVGLIDRSGSPRILRLSFCSFISSSV